MEKITIFVVSHKPAEATNYPGRKIIYVGKNHGCTPDFNTTFIDSTGDNISKLNPYYCELTALYWVWKNAPKSEYVGFEHYSRNYTANMINLASLDYLYRKATKCDMVRIFAPRHLKSNLEVFLEHEGKTLYPYLRDGIKEVAPEYFDDWNKIMHRHHLSYCNMFICKWELFDKYMNFIFGILNRCFENMSRLSELEKSRSIGFMAERLLDAFILHNNLKDKSCWIKTKKH